LTTSWAISRRTVLTEQQRTDAISQLNWLKAGTYKLPASNSTIALPEGYLMVRGEDARRLLTLSAESDDAADAVVMSPHFNDEIVFENAQLLPALRNGEIARLENPTIEDKETRPLPRYNEHAK
jgi:DNA topoisomerase IA